MTPVQMVDNLVLGTVNASYKRSLDVDRLAALIRASDIDAWLPHIATFFAEVSSHLVLAFAQAHDIPLTALAATYGKVKALTGEENKGLDDELSKLARAA